MKRSGNAEKNLNKCNFYVLFVFMVGPGKARFKGLDRVKAIPDFELPG